MRLSFFVDGSGAPAALITQGGESLKVAHHLWVGSKAGWDEIGGSARQHAEGLRS